MKNQPLSEDEKIKIYLLYKNEQWFINQIARKLKRNPMTIRRCLKKMELYKS